MKTRPEPAQHPAQYTLGIDFGTLSARALLVEIASGKEVATSVAAYGDGVIEERLPGQTRRLSADAALQNPADYMTAFKVSVKKLLRESGIPAQQIGGIGIDFTCCTILPTDADGGPLCLQPRWRHNPHAWVKLWKHHSAQTQADKINASGVGRGETFIKTYGGKYSCEWFFSKVLETLEASPDLYHAASRFIEAGDWIVWQLCGQERRSLSLAGFKAMWVHPDGEGGWGFPSPDFFGSLHPKLRNVVAEKLPAQYFPLSSIAGGLTPAMAKATGLLEGTPVAVANIDAHAAVPACTVTTPGKLVMILGTSTCHLLLSKTRQEVEGMCGVVQDGVVNGLWGYEAGQAGVGDLFAWFMEQAAPASIASQARKAGTDLYAYLAKEATALKPGESGLIALDWWNGNRSVLVDADLTGLIVGVSLGTRPHEIYRALIEATAFGTRRIIEAFTDKDIRIDEVYACGGLAKKNPLLMQIYADVTGRPIQVASSDQASALGAAMHAAVASGAYANMAEAAEKMAKLERRIYKPNPANHDVYEHLYGEYCRLYDFFGRNQDGTMKVLKRLRRQALA